MTVQSYAAATSIIFLLVGVLHLVRVVLQWDVMIGTWHFPIWASVVAIIVAGFLSFAGYRLYRAQRVGLFR
jgi:hypothetical protein